MTVDGQTPRTSAIDLTSFRGDGYDVLLLDKRRLQPGRHTVRFTLAGAGRGGGTAVALERRSLVTSPSAPDIREEVTVDNDGLGFSVVGTWNSGRSIPGYYGYNYLTHAKGTGANFARFRPASASAAYRTADRRVDVHRHLRLQSRHHRLRRTQRQRRRLRHRRRSPLPPPAIGLSEDVARLVVC
ncbi:hypothetical protein [Kribbella antiqua]|uniref:hypothetical protein n=1 Tax=Kribbella antiqua TaxID=2512217 RepID=UPI00104A837B|nr:hypothetical protein [Kribbella antiqua]